MLVEGTREVPTQENNGIGQELRGAKRKTHLLSTNPTEDMVASVPAA